MNGQVISTAVSETVKEFGGISQGSCTTVSVSRGAVLRGVHGYKTRLRPSSTGMIAEKSDRSRLASDRRNPSIIPPGEQLWACVALYGTRDWGQHLNIQMELESPADPIPSAANFRPSVASNTQCLWAIGLRTKSVVKASEYFVRE